MRLTPRTVCRFLFFAFLALALLQTSVWAQQRGRTPRTQPPPANNAERAKLAQAATLLVETADKARLFDDLAYRARVQLLAADALWPYDKQKARTIFRRAWEAATASDEAEEEDASVPEEQKSQGALRDYLIEKVAARDSQLANEFLKEVAKEEADEQGSDQSPQSLHDAWRELSPDGERRLNIASILLQHGDARRAAEIATPVINEGVNVSLVEFILNLRARQEGEADALYMRLIGRAAADPRTDANDVLTLSAPIVSPNLLVHVDEFGALKFFSLASASAQQAVPQPIQTAFYKLAASVLLRPLTSADGTVTMQELIASFYATGRLLPFFENASAPYVTSAPALRARQSELLGQIEAGRREQVAAQFGVSSLTRTGNVDPLRLDQEELMRASDNTAERERVALGMIRKAVQLRFWDRARRAAGEIENLDTRRAALTYIQVYQIQFLLRDYADEKEDDFESIVTFVRGADVPPFAKAWGLAQAAVVAARKRGPQTSQTIAELINEAESSAAHADQGTPESAAAYAVVTRLAARLDQQRAWSLLHEYVKAANAIKDFTGDDRFTLLRASDPDPDGRFAVQSEMFRLDGIFATMARLDFDKALMEARALDGGVPQAFATIVVAQSRIQESETRSQKESRNP